MVSPSVPGEIRNRPVVLMPVETVVGEDQVGGKACLEVFKELLHGGSLKREEAVPKLLEDQFSAVGIVSEPLRPRPGLLNPGAVPPQHYPVDRGPRLFSTDPTESSTTSDLDVVRVGAKAEDSGRIAYVTGQNLAVQHKGQPCRQAPADLKLTRSSQRKSILSEARTHPFSEWWAPRGRRVVDQPPREFDSKKLDGMFIRHKGTEAEYVVRWYVSPSHRLELSHTLIAGIGAMARTGALSLNLQTLKSTSSKEGVLRWDVQNIDLGLERKIAFEEFDRNDIFDHATLEEVECYFKRNYSPEATLALPLEWRSKVLPGGIIFGGFTDGSWRLSGKAALASFVAEIDSLGFRGFKRALRRLAKNFDDILGYLNVSALENIPNDPVSDRLVFQTRIWPTESDPEIDRREVNTFRIAIVRALRAEFGSTDLIGLLQSDFALETAPDAILSRKVRRKEYAQQLRTSLIAVNSHGLDGSGGYKLGEALAAGCALVSQPFVFDLPKQLIPEVNYLPFRTPEECVNQCRRLLADRPLAERMRAANQEYYRANVQPEAFARDLLARAFSPCQQDAISNNSTPPDRDWG